MSTLRDWSTLYADWLSPLAANGRDKPRAHRRYTPDDVAVLSQLAKFFQAGYRREDVFARLPRPTRRTVAAPAPPAPDARDERIAALERELEAEKDLVKHVYGRIAPLERRLDKERATVEQLQRALEQAEAVKTQLRRENPTLRFMLTEGERERRMPLWKRVLG